MRLLVFIICILSYSCREELISHNSTSPSGLNDIPSNDLSQQKSKPLKIDFHSEGNVSDAQVKQMEQLAKDELQFFNGVYNGFYPKTKFFTETTFDGKENPLSEALVTLKAEKIISDKDFFEYHIVDHKYCKEIFSYAGHVFIPKKMLLNPLLDKYLKEKMDGLNLLYYFVGHPNYSELAKKGFVFNDNIINLGDYLKSLRDLYLYEGFFDKREQGCVFLPKLGSELTHGYYFSSPAILYDSDANKSDLKRQFIKQLSYFSILKNSMEKKHIEVPQDNQLYQTLRKRTSNLFTENYNKGFLPNDIYNILSFKIVESTADNKIKTDFTSIYIPRNLVDDTSEFEELAKREAIITVESLQKLFSMGEFSKLDKKNFTNAIQYFELCRTSEISVSDKYKGLASLFQDCSVNFE